MSPQRIIHHPCNARQHQQQSQYHPSCVVAFTCLHSLNTYFPCTSQYHHLCHHRQPNCYHNHRRRTRFVAPLRTSNSLPPRNSCYLYHNVYNRDRSPTLLTSTATTNDADHQSSSIPVPSPSSSRTDLSDIAPLSQPSIPSGVVDEQQDEQSQKEQLISQNNISAPDSTVHDQLTFTTDDDHDEKEDESDPDPNSESEPISDVDINESGSDDSIPSSTSSIQSPPQSSSTKKKPRYVPGRTLEEIEAQLISDSEEQQRRAQLAISGVSSTSSSNADGSETTRATGTNAKEGLDDDGVVFSTMFSLSELMRQEGHMAEANGEHNLAVQLYWRAVDLDKHNGKAWQNLAKCEGRRKRSMRANANVLRRAIEHNPRNAYLFQSLGFVLFRMRQYDEARSNFQIGISRDPNHAPLYSTWAHLEYALRNITKARQLYQKGCSLKIAEANSATGEATKVTGVARVYHNWGNMELKLGNQQRALELFDKGLEIEPYNCYIWETLGSLAKKENDIERARECYQNALKSNDTNVVVYEALAKLEASCGNIELARSLFEKGVELEIRDARILQSWAQFEMKLDRFEAAKEKIEKAVLLSPTDSMLWTQYARIESALEHFPRARAMFNRACELQPKDWRAWDAWSVMEHELGNYEQAEKLLHESFRVRFNAKGDFSILANSITDRFTH